MLQLRFIAKDPANTLKIFEVNQDSLKEFTNISGKYDYSCLPDDKFRND
jgi:hypothetical protein